MTIFQASVLGLIEGVTEFLPISSTAHLLVAQRLFGLTSNSLFFDTVVQLGALGAVIVFFWRRLWEMLIEAVSYVGEVVKGKTIEIGKLPLGINLLIATVPVLVVGFIFRKQIEIVHESLLVISATSILVAIVLAVAQWVDKRRLASDKKVTLTNMVKMGLWQILALIPGTSRSGIVIAGGLFEGLSFEQALEFAFYMSVPSLGAAGAFELLSAVKDHPDKSIIMLTAVATLISFVSAMVVIKILLAAVRKIGFMPFVIYRIIFGIAILFIR